MIMLGPETEGEAREQTLSPYGNRMMNQFMHEDHNGDKEEIIFVDNVEETGQEILLPTASRYGLIKRYKSNLKKKLQEKRIEDEETLLAHMSVGEHNSKYSKMELNKMKSDLEKFFRNSGAVKIDSLNSSPSGSSYEATKYIRDVIEAEFPVNKHQIPKVKDLLYVGAHMKNKGMYSPGDWVEIEGRDMIWRLDMITRALKQAPDEWDWNNTMNEGTEPEWRFTYNAGLERNIKEEDLRAPEAGLKILFGCRPWVWQQWAVLKVEEKLRFQEGHQDDFQTKDIQKLANDLWEQWLDHPANTEFAQLFYDERIGERGRTALVNHIQKPFQLMDSMGEENKEWDFYNDDDINVFTYVSLHGSGLVIPFCVLFVQLAIPQLLLYESSGKGTNCDFDLNNGINGIILTKIMTLIIFVYYMYSIIPDTYFNFYNVAGAADSVFSRLLSIRRLVWAQGDDTLMQMLGFKLDIYMNTAYQSLLMMLNIYVILRTDEAIEIVLNALAFIFIARIDEDLAQAGWYDPGKRWLTAGAVETTMQGIIRLRVLSSPKLFSKRFDIHEELLLKVCDGDHLLLCNHNVAKDDSTNSKYMTMEERINAMCAKVAEETNNQNAQKEYKKEKAYFGYLESFLNLVFGRSYSAPIFERFTKWRTWSRWDKVLYLSPVPILDDIFTEDSNGELIFTNNIDEIAKEPIANFYPHESTKSNIQIFATHVVDVLLFRNIVPTLKPVFQFRYIGRLLFRLGDIGLNWLFYCIQFIFPLYLTMAFIEVVYNIIYLDCFDFNPLNLLASWLVKLFQKED